MLTCSKENALEYCIFRGGPANIYPGWFLTAVEDHLYDQELVVHSIRGIPIPRAKLSYHGNAIPEEDRIFWPNDLHPGRHVMLRNIKGDTKLVDWNVFTKRYAIIDDIFATRLGNELEYVIWLGNHDVYPDWFMLGFEEDGHIKTIADAGLYQTLEHDEDGYDFAVFLRNHNGEILGISRRLFDETYIW